MVKCFFMVWFIYYEQYYEQKKYKTMKGFIVMICIALIWGMIMGTIFEPPLSYILSFVGGGVIGLTVPKLVDRLDGKE